MVYITMLIIGVLRFIITLISTFSGAFLSEIQLCLPEAILYKIYMVYIDFITMMIIEVLSFSIIPISTVSEIQKCFPEVICCYITRFTLFTEILSQR